MKQINVKKIIGEIAGRHGVLIEENDPLMVALTANGAVLDALANELLSELHRASARLEGVSLNLPADIGAILIEAAEQASTSVRKALESDIEGAGLKARAIVDAVYRAQSRTAMWIWITTGLLTGAALFGTGLFVGRFWWR